MAGMVTGLTCLGPACKHTEAQAAEKIAIYCAHLAIFRDFPGQDIIDLVFGPIAVGHQADEAHRQQQPDPGTSCHYYSAHYPSSRL